MKPKWHDIVAQVLSNYSYDNSEIALMLDELRATGHYAQAKSYWANGEPTEARRTLMTGLLELKSY